MPPVQASRRCGSVTQVLGCPPVQVGVSAWVTVVGITQRVVQGYGVNPERGCKSGKKKMGTTDPRTEASFHTARISAGPAMSAWEALNFLLNLEIPRKQGWMKWLQPVVPIWIKVLIWRKKFKVHPSSWVGSLRKAVTAFISIIPSPDSAALGVLIDWWYLPREKAGIVYLVGCTLPGKCLSCSVVSNSLQPCGL